MNKRLCIFGEVLFDHFPTGERVLGGAPFNVAWHLQAFAQSPVFISRVGDDAEGQTIRDAMQQWGMTTDGLQLDSKLPTGRVDVSIHNNEPAYDIVEHCAYDAIAPIAEDIQCQLLYHGSLALREAASRQTLASLVAKRPGIVFVDVNLRPPWWQGEHIQEILHGADWVKLNTDELAKISPAVEAGGFVYADILAEYTLKGLIVTHGAQGAEVFVGSGEHLQVTPAGNIDIIDTVGAGDAFTSIMILGLANEWDLQTTLQRAQDFASALVGNRGATVSDPKFYQSFINDWD